MINTLVHKPPSPKRLILSLLSATDMQEISVRQCTRWGDVFAIDAATMRVSLGRMVKGGLLRSLRRGVYVIGPQGQTLSRTARGWRDVEARLRPWAGDWLLVHTAHLGRSNRSGLRSRERALRLEGMQPLQNDFWCRPANYGEPLQRTRERLVSLGLDSAALVLIAAEVTGIDDSAIRALWPVARLEADYHRYFSALGESSARIGSLGMNEAARETFLLGEAVIRLINADPLLPEELIDVDARGKLIAAMASYDQLGRGVWRRFRDAGNNA